MLNSRITHRLSAVLSLALALAPCAFAQSLGKDRRANKPPQSSTAGWVSRNEANAALTKVQRVIYQVVLDRKAPSIATPSGSGICTRAEVVDVMYNWMKVSESAFKWTPFPGEYDKQQFSIPTGHPSRSKLEKLVSWGFVARVDALATGTKPGLSPSEMGDAIGYFLCRLSELTHLPSSKFSPTLMGNGD